MRGSILTTPLIGLGLDVPTLDIKDLLNEDLYYFIFAFIFYLCILF